MIVSTYSHIDNILFVSSHELGRPSQPEQSRERQIRELQEENKKLQQQQKEYEKQIQDLQQQLNGNVYARSVSPENCYATGNGLEEAIVGEQTIAVVHVIDEEGSEYDKPLDNMKCNLISEANGTVVKCKVEKKESHYEISYQPTHRGKHQLSIRVGGVHIRGSPFSVVVKAPVPLRQRDLFGISLVMFLIVMTTLTAVVIKFSTKRLVTPIRIIDGISLPQGMAVRDNGEIVVAEDGSHCVSIFAHNGKKIRTFGTKGSNEGQFDRPSGVAFDSAGNILVVDGYNLRIEVREGEAQVGQVEARTAAVLRVRAPACRDRQRDGQRQRRERGGGAAHARPTTPPARTGEGRPRSSGRSCPRS